MIAVGGVIITLVIAWLGTRFVLRLEFITYTSKNEEWFKIIDKRLMEIEKSNAILDSTVKNLPEGLVRVETTIGLYMSKQFESDRRIARLEQTNDDRKRGPG